MLLFSNRYLSVSIASVLAQASGGLTFVTRPESCPPNRYSIIEGLTPEFSSCAISHHTTTQGEGEQTWSYRQYVSSNARPPVVQINRASEPLSTGLIFITPEEFNPIVGREVPAALIIRDDGDLVWEANAPTPGAMIINLQPQQLYDKPVITYWNGTQGNVQGYGAGAVEILNNTYDKIFSVCPKININLDTPLRNTVKCYCDYHESLITPDNTILVTVYNKTTADLSSIGGLKEGYVMDSLAVEVDIDTNEPLFVWSALEHVAISESRRQIEQTGTLSMPYDWFHINSIQPWGNGFLINSRHTWTTYHVSREGQILWRINGANGGDLGSLPEQGHFSWQHDARIANRSDSKIELTYFANNEISANGVGSVALALSVTMPPNKNETIAVLLSLSDADRPVLAGAGGSHTILHNGNRFVGYGDHPFVKEFASVSNGGTKVIWSAEMPYTRHSYRSYKKAWHANPSTRPDLVIRRTTLMDMLKYCAQDAPFRGYVSWNGATDVAQYAIYIDFGDGEMVRYVTVMRKGFETEFVVPNNAARVQAAALRCPGGHEVRRSSVVKVT